MTTEKIEIIGENYEWHEQTAQIVHKITRVARPESDYWAKIDVYEDRVKGWFFDVVDKHVNPQTGPGDYIAVMVVLGYIEGVEQYRNGERTPDYKSRQWFSNSIRRIFLGVPEEAVKSIVTEVLQLFVPRNTGAARAMPHHGIVDFPVGRFALRLTLADWLGHN